MICNRENSGIARDGADAGGKALAILYYFYPEDTPLRRMLVRHCEQVREKALAILADSGVELDARLAADGAMLHDIGIGRCDAPKILCEGSEPYIAHGVIGARRLREYGAANGLELEAFARICERHTALSERKCSGQCGIFICRCLPRWYKRPGNRECCFRWKRPLSVPQTRRPDRR